MKSWTDLLHQMHTMGTKTGECLGLLQKAFMYSSQESLAACITQIDGIKALEPELSKKIKDMIAQNKDREHFAEIPQHFLQTCKHLEVLADALKKKIDGNILFSDRAVTEISFLSQSLVEALKVASDLILVKNPILVRYVQESEIMVEKATSEYATHHEERLIEGLCQPVASPVFLKILEAMKGVAHKAREIAENMSA